MTVYDKTPCSPSVALMTFVLQEHHCVILEDWINFFDHPVAEMVVHLGADPGIVESVRKLCETYNIRLHNLGVATPQATTEMEQALLAEQFDAVTADFGCVVRLDTIPYRTEKTYWQDNSIDLMRSTGACFITGSTLPYRADLPTALPGFLLTQRISNCFLIIRPEVWKELQAGTKDSMQKYGRFFVEGAAEDYVQANNIFGIRLVNRPEIRIFHCQEWSERLLSVRRSFRDGYRIASFLNGYQDDFFGEKAKHYMQRPEPLIKRLRIFFGYWRRRLLKQL